MTTCCLDARDNRRCDCWASSPARQWSTPVFLLAVLVTGFVGLFLLGLGQQAMCAAHDNTLRYCPGYTATDNQEPRR